jgi:hypothetical protein
MLDPQRIGLNAASVGFLTRTGQKVDWASFRQAMQTDESTLVRNTMEKPVDELHVMGGQRYGLEGNVNLKDRERQARQMAGYPLRSFSADNPVIVLPTKFGGLPLYTRNQTEYADFVSSFSAPMSFGLQNNTILLGQEGYSVTNESASDPFTPLGFEHNMHKSAAAIEFNESVLQQKRYVMRKRSQQGFETGVVRGGSSGQPASIRGSGLAVGVGAGGRPQFMGGESVGESETDYILSKRQRKIAREQGRPVNAIANAVPAPVGGAIAAQVIAHPAIAAPPVAVVLQVKANTRAQAAAAQAAAAPALGTPVAPRHANGPRAANYGGNANNQKAARPAAAAGMVAGGGGGPVGAAGGNGGGGANRNNIVPQNLLGTSPSKKAIRQAKKAAASGQV